MTIKRDVLLINPPPAVDPVSSNPSVNHISIARLKLERERHKVSNISKINITAVQRSIEQQINCAGTITQSSLYPIPYNT